MIDDDLQPAVSSTRYPKARKTYNCCECRRVISVGETYERTWGVWDGHPSTYTICEHCIDARRWLERECGGWLYEGVYEDLESHRGELVRRPIELRRLIVGMRRQWKRFDGAGLMEAKNERNS